MEREGLPGTLLIWPGIAEEQLGGKAFFVRAGVFDDVDIVLYSHVSSAMTTAWGDSRGNWDGLGRVHLRRRIGARGPATRGTAAARSTRSS